MHQSRVGNERSYHLKAQLLAILFYITPPNIFILPSSGCTDLFSAFMPLYTPVYYQLCYAKVYHYEAFLSGRLIVASLTILVAFVDYRNALLMIFRRKKVNPMTALLVSIKVPSSSKADAHWFTQSLAMQTIP
uniref:G protein-coupled receptor n=1 Tax=Steinernema glaseri TaxID=37863 RepID=A0A1I8AE68_9BILA